jgi:cytosine deaminase
MNTYEKYMKLAIAVARDSELKGGIAIGSIIIKNGELIAKGLSKPWHKRDPSNHGDIYCIRNCSKKIILWI